MRIRKRVLHSTGWVAALILLSVTMLGCGAHAAVGGSTPPTATDWTLMPTDGLGALSVTAIAPAPHHALYVGTAGSGVFLYRAGHWHPLGLAQALGSRTVRSLAVEPSGTVVAGTSEGVFVYRQRWIQLTGPTPPGLPVALSYGDIPVYSADALVSPHGHIVAAGYPPGNVSIGSASDYLGGVWQYQGGRWVPVGHLGHTPTAAEYLPNGTLVVGTHDGVWQYTRAHGWTAVGSFPVSDVVVTALGITAGHHILAAVSESAGTAFGLYEFVGGFWSSRTTDWTEFPSPPYIQALALDPANGVVVVGTGAAGVWAANANTLTQVGSQHSLMVTSSVQALYVAGSGTIWAGTSAGLWRISSAGP